jgi:hypothetical protein
MSGDTVVAGAPYRVDGASSAEGAVYVFTGPPPTITITQPAGQAIYTRGEVVRAAFACAQRPGWSRVASCVAPVANGSPIDTRTLGPHVFAVTATDSAGHHSSRRVSYTVLPGAHITIVTPAEHAVYTRGQVVQAAYSCTAALACTAPVANGSPIDTRTIGTHAFTVTATDSLGHHSSRRVSYTVEASRPPTLAHVRESHRVWREGNRLATISRTPQPPVGTTFFLSLNERATVHFAFTQPATGAVTRTTLIFIGHSGTNHVAFEGRTSRSTKLKPGRYTVTITATNPAGHSKATNLAFTILNPKHPRIWADGVRARRLRCRGGGRGAGGHSCAGKLGSRDGRAAPVRRAPRARVRRSVRRPRSGPGVCN